MAITLKILQERNNNLIDRIISEYEKEKHSQEIEPILPQTEALDLKTELVRDLKQFWQVYYRQVKANHHNEVEIIKLPEQKETSLDLIVYKLVAHHLLNRKTTLCDKENSEIVKDLIKSVKCEKFRNDLQKYTDSVIKSQKECSLKNIKDNSDTGRRFKFCSMVCDILKQIERIYGKETEISEKNREKDDFDISNDNQNVNTRNSLNSDTCSDFSSEDEQESEYERIQLKIYETSRINLLNKIRELNEFAYDTSYAEIYLEEIVRLGKLILNIKKKDARKTTERNMIRNLDYESEERSNDSEIENSILEYKDEEFKNNEPQSLLKIIQDLHNRYDEERKTYKSKLFYESHQIPPYDPILNIFEAGVRGMPAVYDHGTVSLSDSSLELNCPCFLHTAAQPSQTTSSRIRALASVNIPTNKSNEPTTGDVTLPDLSYYNELPIDLPFTAQFHSIIICPVLKVPCCRVNPPIALECMHVISREAVKRLNNMNGYFDCPYCPRRSHVNKVFEIFYE